MKISEVVAKLEAIRAEHGDVHVAHDMDQDGMNWVEAVDYVEEKTGEWGHQAHVEISGVEETIGEPM